MDELRDLTIEEYITEAFEEAMLEIIAEAEKPTVVTWPVSPQDTIPFITRGW